MSTDEGPVNYPAVAWAWLNKRLAALDTGSGPSILEEWRQLRQDHDGLSTLGTSIIDWPSDYWIAKTQSSIPPTLVPVWSVPEAIDQWSTLGPLSGTIDARWRSRRTNSGSFAGLLAESDLTNAKATGEAVRHFYDLNQASATHGNQAMTSAAQIRAWVRTAFGNLLAGVAFSPPDDHKLSVAVQHRVSQIDALPHERQRNSWLDYGCEILYNLRMTPEGVQQSGLGIPRQGQGTDWQHDWGWLSTPQDTHQLEKTVQLAGQLMINDAMLTGLTLVVANEGKEARRRALCVIRRWLLTTKVLAWLVESLRHPWAMVRPQDLATFAFSALAPVWPRRAVALSHRSDEAKPVLTTLNLWNSPHVAVDATYVPAWETNTGMVWSLFGPVPLLVRVMSRAYFSSEWCRREHEMFQYLLEGKDFLGNRTILDVDLEDLPELDRALFRVEVRPGDAVKIASFPVPDNEFPPLSLVLLADVAVDLDVALLRAASALRLINAYVGDPLLANRIAQLVADGADLNLETPTNNPDGWAAYGEVFRDLEVAVQRELALSQDDQVESSQKPMSSLPLLLPKDYSEIAAARDRLLSIQIPDMREGIPRLTDILAALEWQALVFSAFNENNYGDKVMVDVSGASVEDWVSDPRRSVARGLVALSSLSPVWILQRDGQSAHTWSGVGERPIFTQHVDHQFSWLKPVSLNPNWLIYYLANSGLKIGPQLEAAMVGAVVKAAGREAFETVEEGDNVGLVVPDPGEFLIVSRDDFSGSLNPET